MAKLLSLDRSQKPAGAPSGPDALEVLHALVADDLKAVNATILSRMDSPVALIPQLAGHLIASGGKRLRPMLTLGSAQLLGFEGDRHTKLAACVEFIHTATLLHDDVVDDSALRRGQETANVLWGNKPSVLVGDFLFSRAFQPMVEDGSLKVLKILSTASSVIAEGEVLQLMTANDTETTEDAYLQVISAKTAELFAAACQISAVVAERGPREEEALASYGRNLGIAFQLIDDALDYSARQAVLGKSVGDDFREGKITLPIVLAYRRCSGDDRAFLERTLVKGDQDEADLDRAIDIIRKNGAIEDTVERGRHYGAIAIDALGIFPANPIKDALAEAVEFAVKRSH